MLNIYKKKIIVWTFGVFISTLSYAQEEQQGAPEGIGADAEVTVRVLEDFGSFENLQGERIDVDGKGFTIIPPIGWEARRDQSGASLIMHPPQTEALKDNYFETVQVLSFNDPKYVDDSEALKFKEWLGERITKQYPNIENFRFLEHMTISTAMDRQGLLFYSEFTLNEMTLMQAQILLSSETNHYLIVYTDRAEHFVGDLKPQFLDVAWESMMSIELDSPTPQRIDYLFDIIIPIVGFILIVVFIQTSIKFRAAQRYKKMLLEADDADTSTEQELQFKVSNHGEVEDKTPNQIPSINISTHSMEEREVEGLTAVPPPVGAPNSNAPTQIPAVPDAQANEQSLFDAESDDTSEFEDDGWEQDDELKSAS